MSEESGINFSGRLIVTLLSFISALVNPLSASAQSTPSDAASFSQRSCQRFGEPLSKASLIRRRTRADGWRGGNSVESAFESFSIGVSFAPRGARENPLVGGERFPSPLRALRTGGSRVNVVPDGLSDLNATLNATVVILGVPIKFSIPYTIRNGAFWEAKTNLGAPLNPEDGSDPWQIGGFIDAVSIIRDITFETLSLPFDLANAEQVSPPPLAALIFVTPASTRISDETINLATERQTLLYRSVICDNEGGSLGTDDVVMGQAILLNEDVAPADRLDEFKELESGVPGSLVVVNPNPPPGGGQY